MTAHPLVAYDARRVKSDLVEQFSQALDSLFDVAATGSPPGDLERAAWKALLRVGRNVLAALFATACMRSTLLDIARRGLSEAKVRLRMDRDYWATVTTTMGQVTFPWFAYRDGTDTPSGSVTRTPARREVFPFYGRCRSSLPCVEWEARLGAEHPFRKAEEALRFFSHGAVEREDTTIARHMVAVARLVDRTWQYHTPEKIAEFLRERAVVDGETGRPILYLSTDAHALRRYVGETWEAAWKMANGLRLWCVDRHDGSVIHLGGEYTWWDCGTVGEILDDLAAKGILPADGDYGDGVVAQITVLTDGAPWIVERVVPRFPGAVCILDLYHLLERLASHAALLYGKGTKKAKAWYEAAARTVAGQSTTTKQPPRRRRGHRKRRRSTPPPPRRELAPPGVHSGEALLEHFLACDLVETRMDAECTLAAYLGNNLFRMDYANLRRRGYQIGSGAMESLHRVASQARVKLPGARWLAETSASVFALRMLQLVGRWDEFWAQTDLQYRLADAFATQGETGA